VRLLTRLAGCRRSVLDWVLRLGSRVAAESLRQASVEELRGLKVAGGNLCRFLLEAVATETPRREGVVEWPDGAVVVADRVVATFAFSERAHAPAGEKARPEQVARDSLCLRLVDDPTPEQVPVVGCERIHLPPVRVERECEVLAVLDPVASELRVGFGVFRS
jgi:hypothetical protein